MTVGKRELVRRIAARTRRSAKDVSAIVTATLEVMSEALAQGETIRLKGFGSLTANLLPLADESEITLPSESDWSFVNPTDAAVDWSVVNPTDAAVDWTAPRLLDELLPGDPFADNVLPGDPVVDPPPPKPK